MTTQQKADKIIDSDALAEHFRELIVDWELTLKSASATEAVYSAPEGEEIILKPHGKWKVRSADGKSHSGVGYYDLWDGGRG